MQWTGNPRIGHGADKHRDVLVRAAGGGGNNLLRQILQCVQKLEEVVSVSYLDSSAISASWTCFLSASCEGKSWFMMSCSSTVGMYFLFLRN